MGIFQILIDDLQARPPLAYHIAPIEDLDLRVKMCRGALDAIPTGMQSDNFLGSSPVMYLPKINFLDKLHEIIHTRDAEALC